MQWNEAESSKGRVLVVDHKDPTHQASFREISKESDLIDFFKVEDRIGQKKPPLRLIHVQYSPWAKDVLKERWRAMQS